jgi:hypothetical protein
VSAVRTFVVRPCGSARRRLWRGLCAVLPLACLLACSGSADAAPSWTLFSTSNTTAAPGGTHDYLVVARNLGDTPTDFSTYTVTITLPPDLTGVSFASTEFDCPDVAGATVFTCTDDSFIGPFQSASMLLTVSVDPDATGIRTARFEIEGGGASGTASTVDPVRISPTLPDFGVDAFDGTAADAADEPLTQAGGHPSRLTTSIDFNTLTDPSPAVGRLRTVEDVKDIAVELPPGFVGNSTAADRCTIPDLMHVDTDDSPTTLCSPTAQVGTVMLRHSGSPKSNSAAPNVLGPIPVYNLVPPSDVPARFGFVAFRVLVLIDAKPRTGGDYGITARLTNVSEGLAAVGTTLTLWGVPADPSHDFERACPGQNVPSQGGDTCRSGATLKAFFRNPTSCTATGVGLPTTLRIDSWEQPGLFKEATFISHLLPGYPFAPEDWGDPIGIDGCDSVPFDPAFSAQPLVGSKAAAPASMGFDVEIPQSDAVESIAQSDLRTTTVTLPRGVRVNPSSADALQGCSSDQIALRRRSDLPRRLEDRHGADRHAAARRAGEGQRVPGNAVRQPVQLARGDLSGCERAGRDVEAAGSSHA